MNRVSASYQEMAREFAERATRELNGDVQAIVLYGSVAGGEARPDSDIDLLVVTPCCEKLRRQVVRIEVDVAARHGYETF